MKKGEILGTLAALALAGISPLIFPISAAGYSTLHDLALRALIPSILLLVFLEIFARKMEWKRLADAIFLGGSAGAIGTIGLEIVREVGFRFFHSMPGELPMLMGVLLTNRMMLGPSLLSNLLGWGYHFWNGACFGMICALTLGKGTWWKGMAYGLLIGVGFMTSPVVVSLGVGYFGRDFGPAFALTVTAAHLAFGAILGMLESRWLEAGSGLVAVCFPRPASGKRQA